MRGGVLTIDLSAISKNYKLLQEKHHNGQVAAVVKANAYGLGAEKVALQLVLEADCKQFFVADFEEAISLRQFFDTLDPELSGDIRIYVLHGLFDAEAQDFREYRLTPVLNQLCELDYWFNEAKKIDVKCDYIVHFDTGMSSLGIQWPEFTKSNIELPYQPIMVMSHLSCADEIFHPQNRKQLVAFRELVEHFPTSLKSLSNSSGVFLGEPFHFDVSRPGRALYGLKPHFGKKNPLEHVVGLQGRVVQTKTLQKGTAVGYGSTYIADEEKQIAIASFGYADGVFRILSNNPLVQSWSPYYKDIPLKILGRVSMDLIKIDISKVPVGEITPGSFIDFVGPHNTADEMATSMHSIGYEVLTSFGPRSKKIYMNEVDQDQFLQQKKHEKIER